MSLISLKLPKVRAFFVSLKLQSTLEQHRFELSGSAYKWICFSINTVVQYCKRVFLIIFLITFSLACFIVRIQDTTHVTYKTRANRLFMLSVRLLLDRRLLNFEGVKVVREFDCTGGSAPLSLMLFKGQLYLELLGILSTQSTQKEYSKRFGRPYITTRDRPPVVLLINVTKGN